MSSMLSTVDNPFDPFNEFDKWFNWDCVHGYNSCGLLDRLSFTSPALPQNENDLEIERAIDEIVNNDMTGLWIKVTNNL